MFAELQHRDSSAGWEQRAGSSVQLTQLEQGPAHLRTPPASRGESHLLLTSHFKGFEAQTPSQLLSSHTGKTGMQKSVNGEKGCFKNNNKNC